MKDLKILLIEDEPMIMKIAQQMLERLGYTPACAINGAQALDLFNKEVFDIVITDIGLPDIDGIALVDRFRLTESMKGRERSHIVAVTAYCLDEVQHQCFVSGVNDLIAKPMTMTLLEHFIGKVICGKASGAMPDTLLQESEVE